MTTTSTTPDSPLPGLVHGLYAEGEPIRDTKAPTGPIDRRWNKRKFEASLVNPANRRKLSVIIVGTGLAGGAAAATLGEAGYNVKSFCYQDSPRRAHSIASSLSRHSISAQPPISSLVSVNGPSTSV